MSVIGSKKVILSRHHFNIFEIGMPMEVSANGVKDLQLYNALGSCSKSKIPYALSDAWSNSLGMTSAAVF